MDELERLMRAYAPPEHTPIEALGKIMVIDDEPGVRRALAQLFGDRGYDVVVYRRGEDALAAFDSTVQVVVLDIRLPKIPGDVIYKQLKHKKDVPIIFHSAYPGEDVENCLQLDPFDYIDKGTPDHYERLCAAVERALHGAA